MGLELPGRIPTRAKVVWSNAGVYGATFERRLSPIELEYVLLVSFVVWPLVRKLRPQDYPERPLCHRDSGVGVRDFDSDSKYSLRTRLGVIIGGSIALWALVTLFLWA